LVFIPVFYPYLSTVLMIILIGPQVALSASSASAAAEG